MGLFDWLSDHNYSGFMTRNRMVALIMLLVIALAVGAMYAVYKFSPLANMFNYCIMGGIAIVGVYFVMAAYDQRDDKKRSASD